MLWHWLSPVKREQFRTVLRALTTAEWTHRACPHGLYRFACRECLRPYNRVKMRQWRLKRLAAALLVAV